jgi:hypothetical protein
VKIRGGAPQVLADLGFPQRTFVDRISARQPTVEEAETLALPTGTPVIRQLRVIHSDDERPVEASVLIKAAAMAAFGYEFGVLKRMRHAGGGRRCLEGALRDTGYVSKVPLGALNDPMVPFGTSVMS